MKIEHYLKELECRCKKPADYFGSEKSENGPDIGVIGFDNYPNTGEFTYFSFGLHQLKKPEWKVGLPEYYIVVNNQNRLFAMYFVYLISLFAPEKIMGWNTLIGVGEGDAIEGYPYKWLALAMPNYLNWESYQIKNSEGLPINLGMGYYIGNSDFEMVSSKGINYLEEKMDEEYGYWKKIKTGHPPPS